MSEQHTVPPARFLAGMAGDTEQNRQCGPQAVQARQASRREGHDHDARGFAPRQTARVRAARHRHANDLARYGSSVTFGCPSVAPMRRGGPAQARIHRGRPGNSSAVEFLIRQHAAGDDNATRQTMASLPLREAHAPVVAGCRGRPGVYRAVSFIRHHFQLDELSVSLRLVAELPPSQKG